MKVDRRALAVKNRQISIRMEQFTDHMVERTGLSTAQAHLLMRILRQGPQGTTLTELHRQCGYSMAALSNILKRLRQGGYVRAETTEADNRCKRLYVTDKAEQAGAALDRALRASCEQAYRGFTEEELCQLEAMQDRLLQNLASAAMSERSGYDETSAQTTQAI